MTKLHSSQVIEDFVKEYRKKVHFVENDEVMYKLIHASIDFIQNYNMK
jgi:histidine ammonia-lyase